MTKKKRNKKPKTISQMTNSRGVMPPSTVADTVKKKKNDRKSVKERIRKGDYDL